MSRQFRGIVTLSGMILVAGCGTTSFAPPVVPIGQKLVLSGKCPKDGKFVSDTAVNDDFITKTGEVVDNYVHAYACQSKALANGRQGFEVPGYLALAGATAAVAFGAGPAVALAGGTAGSVFASGKNYFDPNAKAALMDKALDAVLCIQLVSVGLEGYAPSDLTLPASAKADSPPISYGEQYYRLVVGALRSVETSLSTRMRGTGTFDSAGTIARIKELQTEYDAARKAADEAKKAKQDLDEKVEVAEDAKDKAEVAKRKADEMDSTKDGPPSPSKKAALQVADDAKKDADKKDEEVVKAKARVSAVEPSKRNEPQIMLSVIAPKLQDCANRMKIS